MADRLTLVVLPVKRGMTEKQAAAYLEIGVDTFRDEMARGVWPPPRRIGRKHKKRVWDRKAIDLAYDRISGIGSGEAEHEAAALAALDRWDGRAVS